MFALVGPSHPNHPGDGWNGAGRTGYGAGREGEHTNSQQPEVSRGNSNSSVPLLDLDFQGNGGKYPLCWKVSVPQISIPLRAIPPRRICLPASGEAQLEWECLPAGDGGSSSRVSLCHMAHPPRNGESSSRVSLCHRLIPQERGGMCSGQGIDEMCSRQGMGRRGLGRARPPWGATGKGPGELGRAQRSQSHHCTELHVLSCRSREFPVGLNCWDEPSWALGRGYRNGSRKGFWEGLWERGKGSRTGERAPGKGSRKGLWERAPSHFNCSSHPQLQVSYPRTVSVPRGARRNSQDAPAGNAGGISRLSQASLMGH